MHLATQVGGGHALIPSIMKFVDGQILIEMVHEDCEAVLFGMTFECE